MKLPVPVKGLLALRNPLPTLNPHPARLRPVFDATLRTAHEKGASRGWLVLAVSGRAVSKLMILSTYCKDIDLSRL